LIEEASSPSRSSSRPSPSRQVGLRTIVTAAHADEQLDIALSELIVSV
jgi:hypothetical protein